MKHKVFDPDIGQRAAEEIIRYAGGRTIASVFREMKVSPLRYREWRCGATPNGQVMARMAQMGMDMDYILRGVRRGGK